MERIYKKGNVIRIKVAPIIWEYILDAYPEKKPLKKLNNIRILKDGKK